MIIKLKLPNVDSQITFSIDKYLIVGHVTLSYTSTTHILKNLRLTVCTIFHSLPEFCFDFIHK